MISTALLALLYIVLAICDWVYSSRVLRASTVAIVILALIFTQSMPRRAARVAWITAPAERVVFGLGKELNAYESGVLTMEREIVRDKEAMLPSRFLTHALLVWFALAPVLRPRHERAAHGVADK